eukprot:CAMPEP_0119032698 /NCGR_PEP_ID=MMETSP1176-20130426/42183_1 /TAXON_ID=265551 /ORGANISM="Synedropsis recta cf, Strain CCMP1620" /LENGTH=204 /DNA_ID=CAMNT_0006989113 /DNA_START=663 /DNA_END=1275 /DNA_ORIENTATION=+
MVVAKVQQFGPCDTKLKIPVKVYDAAACTSITGWYDTCAESDPGAADNELCSVDTFQYLDDPLFIDLELCDSLPPFHDGRSIGSIRRGNADGNIKESHHIFKSNGPDECRPFSCEPTGGSGCTCPPVIVKLKAQFEAAERYSTSAYSCTSGDFDGDTDRCFVPATTIGFGDPDFYCSMLARVEQFLPCDKTLISCSGTNPTGDA